MPMVNGKAFSYDKKGMAMAKKAVKKKAAKKMAMKKMGKKK